MQIAILLFDRFTVLDAIGPYQVLSGPPGAEVAFVAERPGLIRDEQGSLIVSAGSALLDVPHPDVVVVGESCRLPSCSSTASPCSTRSVPIRCSAGRLALST